MPISKRNRRGLLLLIFIAALISYAPRIITAIKADENLRITFEELEVIEDEIEVKREFRKSKKKKVWASKYKTPPTAFNPNEYSKNDWMSLGLSEKQSDVVLKFSKRGLRSNDDLEKIFVIPSELFNRIKDSTFYPQIEYTQKLEEAVIKQFTPIDINTANAEELKTIPGIGDFYAEKILEYRSDLGGYLEINQLLEIWKFDSEKLEEIKDKIALSESGIRRMDINEVSIDELKSHPYISYKVANSIVKMRIANGNYHSVEGIRQSKLINEELYLKIKNYLKV